MILMVLYFSNLTRLFVLFYKVSKEILIRLMRTSSMSSRQFSAIIIIYSLELLMVGEIGGGGGGSFSSSTIYIL